MLAWLLGDLEASPTGERMDSPRWTCQSDRTFPNLARQDGAPIDSDGEMAILEFAPLMIIVHWLVQTRWAFWGLDAMKRMHLAGTSPLRSMLYPMKWVQIMSKVERGVGRPRNSESLHSGR